MNFSPTDDLLLLFLYLSQFIVYQPRQKKNLAYLFPLQVFNRDFSIMNGFG